MSMARKVEKLQALPFVLKAVEIGADCLTVLAVDPTLEEYEAMDVIAGDADLEVCPLLRGSGEQSPLFLCEQAHHEWRGASGELRLRGEGKMIQDRFDLDFEPRTNVLVGDQIGLLFGSPSDLAKYRDGRQRR